MTLSSSFYTGFALAWAAIALCIFVVLLFIEAPYGRYTRQGFGPKVGRRLGWIVMETPAFLGMILFFVLGNRHQNTPAMVFLGLWMVHYFFRTYVFPFRMRGATRSMTLLPVFFGVLFNFGNTYLNGAYLFNIGPMLHVSWLWSPLFLVGTALFFTGFGINLHSDGILRGLRKEGETGYKIPRGGLFEKVSAANYFGECLEWLGFAIATWSPGGLVFFLWTFCNLAPRARAHHLWYRQTFPDYPKGRKAIIPYVF